MTRPAGRIAAWTRVGGAAIIAIALLARARGNGALPAAASFAGIGTARRAMSSRAFARCGA